MRSIGKPYSKLVEDLSADPKLAKYNLAEAAKKPPKIKGALNIEGLGDFGDGKLPIGFRNPLPDDMALLVPLENPEELVNGAPAKLGSPIELFLGGRGVRSSHNKALKIVRMDSKANVALVDVKGHQFGPG